MNTQHKKLMAVAAVILFHVGVITIMLAQHGCKSDGTAPAAAEPSAPAPAAPAPSPVAASTDNTFVTPTRPAPEAPVTPALPVPLTQMSEPLPTAPATPVVSLNPPPTPVAEAPSPSVTLIVARGDTLTSIARKNGITVSELVAANAPKLTAGSTLHIGESLVIPNPKPASSAPSAAATPAAADDAGTYKVMAGDSLGKIAYKNHTTVKAIKELNNLTSDNIKAGQLLKLPAASAIAAAATAASGGGSVASGAESGTYTVKSGDSLERIARSVHVNVSELMGVNGLTQQTARTLRPGQVLKLPSGAQAPATAPAENALPPVTTQAAPEPALLPPLTVPATAVPASGTGAPPVTPVN